MSAASIPKWKLSGDFFDFCKCNIPCPCTFAQAPTHGDCEDVLAYHIKSGRYGETSLDGLNVLALSYFKGNIWEGNTKANIASFVDERADQQQREALQMIFTGKAGGFMAQVSNLIEEDRGLYFAPIKLEVADDLSYWSAEIPGKIVAKAEALTGPMTPPGKRVQTLNPPGSEVGPSTIVTWEKLSQMRLVLQKFISNGREKAGQASTVHSNGWVHNKILSGSFAIVTHKTRPVGTRNKIIL